MHWFLTVLFQVPYNNIFWLRLDKVFCGISGLRAWTTLDYSHISFFFVIVTFLLQCCNFVINAFVTTTHITLFFGTFKLRIKVVITLLPGLPLWDTLYRVTTKFFQVTKKRILNNIKVLCLMVRSNYVRKYNTITLHVGSSFFGLFWCGAFV